MKRSTLATCRQYFAAVAVSISVVILGTSLGWPSPVLVKMEEEGYPFSMTSSEVSWMVSILYVGNFLSPLPAGYLMDAYGRKTSMVVLAVIPLSSWVAVYFATSPVHLYGARFLSGFWSGVVSTVTPMYLGEISEPRIRGALSTLIQLMTNIGTVFEYLIGPLVSYKVLAVVSGSLPVLFVMVFSWVPESPYWLIMNNKMDSAGQSLAWFRGTSVEESADEFHSLVFHVQEELKNKKRLTELVRTPGSRKALVIVQVLAILQRMSGISALMAYSSTTLPADGVGSLTPNDCVLILGLVWVVSVFIATGLVDSLGRRPLLLISSTVCGLAMFSAGLWFLLNDETNLDVSYYSWVPFASFLLYGITFCIGLGPIASTIQGEAFPSNTKALASGITSVVLALTSFIMNKIYHPISEGPGMYLNYWIFSGACATAAIFVVTYVVETKGKSLHEIQQELEGYKPPKSVKPSTF